MHLFVCFLIPDSCCYDACYVIYVTQSNQLRTITYKYVKYLPLIT